MRKWIRLVLVALCLFVILTTVLNAMRRPEPFRDTAIYVLLWGGLAVIVELIVVLTSRRSSIRRGAYDIIVGPLTPENAQARRDFLARFGQTAPKEIVDAMRKSLEESEPLPDWVSLKDVPLELQPIIRQGQASVWKAMRPRPAVPGGGPTPPPEDMIAAASLEAISEAVGPNAPVTSSSTEKDSLAGSQTGDPRGGMGSCPAALPHSEGPPGPGEWTPQGEGEENCGHE